MYVSFSAILASLPVGVSFHWKPDMQHSVIIVFQLFSLWNVSLGWNFVQACMLFIYTSGTEYDGDIGLVCQRPVKEIHGAPAKL